MEAKIPEVYDHNAVYAEEKLIEVLNRQRSDYYVRAVVDKKAMEGFDRGHEIQERNKHSSSFQDNQKYEMSLQSADAIMRLNGQTSFNGAVLDASKPSKQRNPKISSS